MLSVHSEHSERLSCDIRIGDPSCFDNGSDVLAFTFEFTFEISSRSSFCDLSETFACDSTIFPEPKEKVCYLLKATATSLLAFIKGLPVFASVRGSYNVREPSQPSVRREIFRMSVSRP